MLKKKTKSSFEGIVSGSSSILESINDAVLLMEGLNFIDCNQKAVELYGFKDKSELIGLNPFALSPEFQSKGLSTKKEGKRRFNAVLKGKPQFFDWVHIRKDGVFIDTEVSLKLIKSKGKKYVIALVRDITEKKKAEKINRVLFNIAKALGNSDSMMDILSVIHKEINTFMDAKNFYVALIVDLEKSSFIFPYEVDEKIVEPTPPDKIYELANGLTDYVARNGKPLLSNRYNQDELSNEYRLIGNDSESWLGVPLTLEHEEIVGVLAVQSYSDADAYSKLDEEVLLAISPTISSVIQQKRSEDMIKQSEEKFRQLFNNIPDAIFITSFGGPDSGKIVEANSAAVQQTGYTLEELIGMNIGKDLQSEWYNEALVTRREDEIADRRFARFREKKKRKDGSIYWTEVIVTKTQVNDQMIALGVNRDISDQIQIEKALKESEEKFRTVIEEAAEIVFTTDNRGYLTYVNPAGIASSGYSNDELMKMKYIDLVEPEYIYQVKTSFFRQYLKKEPLTSGVFPYITKSGENRWYHVSVRLVLEKDEVDGFYIIARDVTEKREAELALEESEQKFRNFIENSGIGFAVENIDGKITYFNNTYADIFGYSLEEMKAKSQDALVHEDDMKVVKKYHQMRINGEESPKQYEVKGIKKDGSQIHLEVSVDKLIKKGGGVSGTQMFFKDITDRKKAETEILRLKENLETQVEEKTRDLLDKISDLQRFHDATIEREFRIKDLNDHIDELKAELARNNKMS